MPVFRLPLSGNVTQSINPVGSQVGLVNIELGQSSNPKVEEEVLSDVASYDKRSAVSRTRSSCCSPISTPSAN
jgi:hypothetical protein